LKREALFGMTGKSGENGEHEGRREELKDLLSSLK
jgi:hypothetical protein